MCKLLWFLYISLLLFKNVKQFTYIFFSGFTLKTNRQNFSEFRPTHSQNIYFFDISEKNLPENGLGPQQKNLVAWYSEYYLKNSPIHVIHNVKDFKNKTNDIDLFTSEYHPYLLGSVDVLLKTKNLFWFIWMVSINLKESFLPNLIFNFNEIWIAKGVMSRANQINLEKIVFNNSIGSLKPLWARVLEKNGIEIDYFFYSSNAEPRDVDDNLPIDGFWALSTWNNFYVVDGYQKNQLFKELIYKPTKIEFGKIVWWTDTSILLPSIKKNSICLFDTILHENRYTLSTLNQHGWYKSEVAINYLQIVLEAATHHNLVVFYKTKRKKARNASNKKHLDAVEILLEKYRDIVLLVDDRFSAERLIENATITISKPLSTTAIIATSINKPSFYLDPTGGVQ
jgi:polysaccharide biosynthesis PFTS motif protein